LGRSRPVRSGLARSLSARLLGAAHGDAQRAPSGGNGVPGAGVADLRLFDSGDASGDAGGRGRSGVADVPVGHRALPGRGRSAGILGRGLTDGLAPVLHAGHDGAARYAGHAVHHRGAAAVSAGPLSRRGAGVRRAGAGERDRPGGCPGVRGVPDCGAAPARGAVVRFAAGGARRLAAGALPRHRTRARQPSLHRLQPAVPAPPGPRLHRAGPALLLDFHRELPLDRLDRRGAGLAPLRDIPDPRVAYCGGAGGGADAGGHGPGRGDARALPAAGAPADVHRVRGSLVGAAVAGYAPGAVCAPCGSALMPLLEPALSLSLREQPGAGGLRPAAPAGRGFRRAHLSRPKDHDGLAALDRAPAAGERLRQAADGGAGGGGVPAGRLAVARSGFGGAFRALLARFGCRMGPAKGAAAGAADAEVLRIPAADRAARPGAAVRPEAGGPVERARAVDRGVRAGGAGLRKHPALPGSSRARSRV